MTATQRWLHVSSLSPATNKLLFSLSLLPALPPPLELLKTWLNKHLQTKIKRKGMPHLGFKPHRCAPPLWRCLHCAQLTCSLPLTPLPARVAGSGTMASRVHNKTGGGEREKRAACNLVTADSLARALTFCLIFSSQSPCAPCPCPLPRRPRPPPA